VGAGCGATLGKWRGRDQATPGGLGTATVGHDGLLVSALVVVNAVGDLRAPGADPLRLGPLAGGWAEPVFEEQHVNTTLGVIVTNAVLDKTACHLVAQSGHDGLARALEPIHTTADGDFLVTAACGTVEARIDIVRALGARAVEAAARSAVPDP
jgi:L-aminopeptidase/D-esterase-like protein